MCEMPSVYGEAGQRARKPHICCECGRQIEIGEIYQKAAGIWEGSPQSFHTCAECWEVREDLREDLPSGYIYSEETACTLAFGNLREAIADEDREVSRWLTDTSCQPG